MKRQTKKRFEKIGFRVRALRRLHGINQTELAHRTGMSQGLISKIERNGGLRSLEDLFAILDAFKVPIQRFLKGIYDSN